MQSREQRFKRLGYSDLGASALATKLMHRDRDLDDRRMCSECQHHDGEVCLSRKTLPAWAKKIGPQLANQLRRCEGFALEQDIREFPITIH